MTTTMTIVHVYARNDQSGSPLVSVEVFVPPHQGVREQAAKIGLPSTKKQMITACRETREFKKFEVMHQQIVAARQKITDATEAVQQAEADKAHLVQNPDSDYIARLREATEEVEKRKAEKAQAEQDWVDMQQIIPALWQSTANALLNCSRSIATPVYLQAYEASTEPKAKLEAAVEKIKNLLRSSIESEVLPILKELAIVKEACETSTVEAMDVMIDGIVRELIGEMPVGVRYSERSFEKVPAQNTSVVTNSPAATGNRAKFLMNRRMQ